ncbi:hypothetical protein QUA24_26465 [Microcoleus sp. Pol12B5]
MSPKKLEKVQAKVRALESHLDWFHSVPMFTPTDATFCLLSYFLGSENDCLDFEFTTKKFVADFVDNLTLEFVAKYQEFFIYYDDDTQTILICKGEEAYESESINLLNLDCTAQSLGDNVLKLAQQFLDALIFEQSYSPGQLQLEFAECT